MDSPLDGKNYDRDANLWKPKIWRLSLWQYPPENQWPDNPPPPPPSDKHKLIQALILSQGNGLGHYMKSYMKYRPSQFTFMVIFVSDEIHAKMPQKKN